MDGERADLDDDRIDVGEGQDRQGQHQIVGHAKAPARQSARTMRQGSGRVKATTW